MYLWNMEKQKKLDRFIKKYLTPRFGGKYKVASDLIDRRFDNFCRLMQGIENEVADYVCNMSSFSFSRTRGYFYFQKWVEKHNLVES